MSEGSPNNVLEVAGLRRTFQQGHKSLEILRGVDITVRPGELVGLVGVSGSGKSTLLQTVGLLDRQDHGEIWIDGIETSELGDDKRTAIRREKLGFIYQFHHLLPDFSAIENVSLAFRIAGESNNASQQAAADLLKSLDLGERFDHFPSSLSGGEQQRVAIARALAASPSLILADEPTGNLDEETASRVFDLFLKSVREQGVAAIIATHDRALASRMDRQLILTDGQLRQI